MKKLRAIVITVLAISLMIGVPGSNSLAGSSYLPLISNVPPPPPVTIDQFVGSWAVSDGTGAIYYLFINSDNTFAWYDHLGDPLPHFSGTGAIVGSAFIGPFTNPGVGDGDLVCTIVADGSMNIDFVEHWHTPDKHVPYTAVKF